MVVVVAVVVAVVVVGVVAVEVTVVVAGVVVVAMVVVAVVDVVVGDTFFLHGLVRVWESVPTLSISSGCGEPHSAVWIMPTRV